VETKVVFFTFIFMFMYNFYSFLSKNGSTLWTFIRSDLVPRVTLIVPFV
jgi:hypothetical protein